MTSTPDLIDVEFLWNERGTWVAGSQEHVDTGMLAVVCGSGRHSWTTGFGHLRALMW